MGLGVVHGPGEQAERGWLLSRVEMGSVSSDQVSLPLRASMTTSTGVGGSATSRMSRGRSGFSRAVSCRTTTASVIGKSWC